MLEPARIKSIRSDLKLTQAQFAQVLGVHALTVSKWERGLLTPTPHHAALIQSFGKAQSNQPNIGQVAGTLLVGAGVAFALYKLLEAAFPDDEKDSRPKSRGPKRK